jgi:VCBS repeat-containing protein/predicted outer membrane repeat protein
MSGRSFRKLNSFLGIQSLEDRTTPATFNITDPGWDVNTNGTLPFFVAQSNATPNPDGDIFNFIIPANKGGTIKVGDSLTFDNPVILLYNNLQTAQPVFEPNAGAGAVGNVWDLKSVFTFTNASSGTASGSPATGVSVIDGLQFQNFKAANPTNFTSGAAINISAGTLQIKNSTFVNNSALNGGVAIVNAGATLSVLGDTFFSKNTAEGLGGVISTLGSATVNVNGASFSNNKAASGGAIHAFGQLSISDTDFTACEATDKGGAIYSQSTVLDVSAGIFTSNKALGSNGGAIYFTSSSSTSTPISKLTGTFTNNEALNGTGGGIFVDEGRLQIDPETIFTTNKAALGGGIGVGGVNVQGGQGIAEVTVTDSKFEMNSKNAIHVFDFAEVTATRTLFLDNFVKIAQEADFNEPNATNQKSTYRQTLELSPEYDEVGIVRMGGDYELTSSGVLALNFSGANTSVAGTDYDQIVIKGANSVTNLGGELKLVLPNKFTPALGTNYTIVDNQNNAQVATTFVGKPEGKEFKVDGVGFKISYVGGTGNDVVLTVVKLPETNDDTFTIHQGSPLTTLGSVLANDITGTVALKGYLETGASKGTTFTFGSYGASVRYKPRAGTIGTGGAITNGFTGTDTFTYVLKQGTYTSPSATGTITVTNAAPTVVQRDQYFATARNVSFHVNKASLLAGVSASDSDADAIGPAMASMTHTNVSFATREGGTVWLNWTTGFSYSPPPRPSPTAPLFEGWDSFEYRVWDKAGFSEVVTVHVAVGEVPPIVMASNFGTTAAGGFAAGNVLAHDAPSNQNVSISGVSLLAGPQHGTLTLNADGSYEYTADEGWSGMDGFTFRVTDAAGEAATAVFTLAV